MSVSEIRERFEAPSFIAAAGTVASYLAILTVMFLLLFVVPFVAFLVLA